MHNLHDEIIRTLEKIPHIFLYDIIERKLKEQGISLSSSKINFICDRILNGQLEPFSMFNWKFWEKKHLTLSFSEEDVSILEKGMSKEFLDEHLSELLKSLSSEMAPQILVDLQRKWPRESRKQQKELNEFRKRLILRWGESLEKMKLLLVLARECGESIYEELRNDIENKNVYLTEVLVRLHARACQVTEEIICLLSHGLADGAMARWRTLHEIAVVSNLIAEHGEELAERYTRHEAVEAFRAFQQYEKYYAALGREPISAKEAKEIRDAYEKVKSEFGKDFTNDYGWAAKHLNNHNPKFIDLEAAVKIDLLRPYYKMASHNVHANPKGIFFKLGLFPDSNILLTGPSNAGLVDPGHSTAISLSQITMALVQISLTFDNILCIQMMLILVNEIGETLYNAHVRLEQDEQANKQSISQ
jgi:hypothetical protein